MAQRRTTQENRRHERSSVDLVVELAPCDSSDRLPGRARDISIGGMQVETAAPLRVSTDLIAYVTFPGQREPLALPAVVRWARAGAVGLQFGLLGARETHAITEVTSRR